MYNELREANMIPRVHSAKVIKQWTALTFNMNFKNRYAINGIAYQKTIGKIMIKYIWI